MCISLACWNMLVALQLRQVNVNYDVVKFLTTRVSLNYNFLKFLLCNQHLIELWILFYNKNPLRKQVKQMWWYFHMFQDFKRRPWSLIHTYTSSSFLQVFLLSTNITKVLATIMKSLIALVFVQCFKTITKLLALFQVLIVKIYLTFKVTR
jgi:hypothetical protein